MQFAARTFLISIAALVSGVAHALDATDGCAYAWPTAASVALCSHAHVSINLSGPNGTVVSPDARDGHMSDEPSYTSPGPGMGEAASQAFFGLAKVNAVGGAPVLFPVSYAEAVTRDILIPTGGTGPWTVTVKWHLEGHFDPDINLFYDVSSEQTPIAYSGDAPSGSLCTNTCLTSYESVAAGPFRRSGTLVFSSSQGNSFPLTPSLRTAVPYHGSSEAFLKIDSVTVQGAATLTSESGKLIWAGGDYQYDLPAGVEPGQPLLPESGQCFIPGARWCFRDAFGHVLIRSYADPEIATGYEYQVAPGSPLFTSVLVPEQAINQADFQLVVGDQAFPLIKGQVFDFRTMFPDGVTQFSIRGIDPTLAVDANDPTAFVTGLTFASSGLVAFTMTPISILTGGGTGDSSPPSAAPTQSPPPRASGWNSTDVTVNWNWADNTGGSGIDAANCTTSSTSTGEGTLTLNAFCRDLAGNVGSAAYPAQVDKTKPTLAPTITPSPVLLNSVATANPNAFDTLSGVATSWCDAVDTSASGSKTVTCNAVDAAGNQAAATVHYTVQYGFSGFAAPLSNPPGVNTRKAGSAYPVKWQLTDANGRYIAALSAVRSITYKPTGCSIFDSLGTNELEAVATGSSSLRYDSVANQYVFNWAMPATGCYALSVTLDSGQVFPVYFNLVR